MPPTAGSSTAEPAAPPHPVLFLDIGHPESLLAAERALQVMPVATEWIPVHLGRPAEIDLDALAARAAERGLQPVRAPEQLPFDAELANLAATFAKSTGRAVAFLQAALRQAYAGARDLSVLDNVLIAGSACELHPRSLLKALETKGTRRTLEQATARARALGVERAPAVQVGERCFAGDAGLDAAAAFLHAQGLAETPPQPLDVLSRLTVIPPRG
ncbi:MAG: disulfide bond formation protein DsbA [Solirubrobacterales bacterium]|nr:disulfide bond formation protein DsbA [Solirubrobacterales bacterium]